MATTYLKSVDKCCARTTAERCSNDSVERRKLLRRGKMVSFNSGFISPGVMIATIHSDTIVRSVKYYGSLLFYKSDVLREMVLQKLQADGWSEISGTAEKRSSYLDGISGRRNLRVEMRRCNPDEFSSQQRKPQNVLHSTAPECSFLRSRYYPNCKEQKMLKKNQDEEKEPDISCTNDNSGWNLAFWRTEDVKNIAVASVDSDIGSFNTSKSEDELHLFKRDARVLPTFMCFLLRSVAYSSSFGRVASTVAGLAKLDAPMTATITCRQAARSNIVEIIPEIYFMIQFQQVF